MRHGRTCTHPCTCTRTCTHPIYICVDGAKSQVQAVVDPRIGWTLAPDLGCAKWVNGNKNWHCLNVVDADASYIMMLVHPSAGLVLCSMQPYLAYIHYGLCIYTHTHAQPNAHAHAHARSHAYTNAHANAHTHVHTYTPMRTPSHTPMHAAQDLQEPHQLGHGLCAAPQRAGGQHRGARGHVDDAA